MNLWFLPLFALLFLNSCYRAPTEDDYSTVPMMNNPDITKEIKHTPMPNVNF